MYWWVIDLDEKGKPLMFGSFWNEDRAETYKDKNCSKIARVVGPTQSRQRSIARKEKEVAEEINDMMSLRRKPMMKLAEVG